MADTVSNNTPAPYHNWMGPEDREREWAKEYDALVGPEFLCVLTEPEDRTWGRDGRRVVCRLNQQHEAIAILRADLKRLWDALESANDYCPGSVDGDKIGNHNYDLLAEIAAKYGFKEADSEERSG